MRLIPASDGTGRYALVPREGGFVATLPVFDRGRYGWVGWNRATAVHVGLGAAGVVVALGVVFDGTRAAALVGVAVLAVGQGAARLGFPQTSRAWTVAVERDRLKVVRDGRRWLPALDVALHEVRSIRIDRDELTIACVGRTVTLPDLQVGAEALLALGEQLRDAIVRHGGPDDLPPELKALVGPNSSE